MMVLRFDFRDIARKYVNLEYMYEEEVNQHENNVTSYYRDVLNLQWDFMLA